MNSQFIRTFADDLAEEMKKYRLISIISREMSLAVITLHYIASLLEAEEKKK